MGEGFCLRDPTNEMIRAELQVGDDGRPTVNLYGADGKCRADLTVRSSGRVDLCPYKESGRTGVFLTLTTKKLSDGSVTGETHLHLYGGSRRVGLEVFSLSEPILVFADKADSRRWGKKYDELWAKLVKAESV